MNRLTPNNRNSAVRGLTLVELMVSTTATVILLGGLASAVLLATQALPENSAELDGIVDAGEAIGQLTSELLCAVSVTENTAAAIEFTVADRSGDNSPETIRYEWSGTAGDPLTRQYNGGSVLTILEDVDFFELANQVTAVTVPGDPIEVESEEILLTSFTGTGHLVSKRVKDDRWHAQYFNPILPGEVLRWRVTRVLFQAKIDGAATGTGLVQLRPADVNMKPTTEVLAQLPLVEADLSDAFEWRDFIFPNAAEQLPGDGLCFVIQHVANSPSGKVHIQDGGVEEPNIVRLQSNDSGGSWNVQDQQSLLFYAYGTVTTLVDEEVVLFYQLTGVRITINVGDGGDRVETSVLLLNAPEL
ncbi:MAG: hypothetical protein KAY37_16470 [Phycisphaerae bacterium]|nr:hypothetical protein [Phycisphaerae bacterium]